MYNNKNLDTYWSSQIYIFSRLYVFVCKHVPIHTNIILGEVQFHFSFVFFFLSFFVYLNILPLVAHKRKFWSLDIRADKKSNKFGTNFYFCLFAWSSFFLKKSYLTQEKRQNLDLNRSSLGFENCQENGPARLSPSSEGAISFHLSVSIPKIPKSSHSLASLIQHTQPARRMRNHTGWSKDRGTLLGMPEVCSQSISVALSRMRVCCVRVCIFLLY